MANYSSGCVRTMLAAPMGTNHLVEFVMQNVGTKELKDASGNIRYRLTLSDGHEVIHGIWGTHIAHMIQNQEIVEGSILKVKNYNLNPAGGGR